jgi:YbdK family carboxylate-amine ligase
VQIEFASSDHASLGVEWELQVVDPATRELVGAAGDLLEDLKKARGGEEHPKAKHELFQSIVEVLTGVCDTVGQATADLAGTIAEVEAVAAVRGLTLACAGTHPLARWQDQTLSPGTRYARLIEDMQWLARRLLITGVHVHVGIRSADKVLPVLNAVTGYLPHFLALSASSPYWAGTDTGLASARSKVFEQLPTAGLPHQLAGWDDFQTYLGSLVSSNAVASIREVWWDVRPHPEFGTVELRMCDGLPTMQEVGAVAALAQCLVHSLDTQLDRGYTLPRPTPWLLRENKWRAARHGLDAELIIDDAGAVRPVREAIAELVEDLAPVARRLGCTTELDDVRTLAAGPGPAGRQRAAVAAAGGDIGAAVDLLVAEFAAGHPLPPGSGVADAVHAGAAAG